MKGDENVDFQTQQSMTRDDDISLRVKLPLRTMKNLTFNSGRNLASSERQLSSKLVGAAITVAPDDRDLG